MNCLIIDDNEMDRRALKLLLNQLESLRLIGECENPLQVVDILNKEKVDLLFLDIEMPEMSGIEFLKNVSYYPPVILITSNKNYALEAYEYKVVDYLVKPLTKERFLKAIFRAQELFNSRPQSTEIPDKEFIFIRDKGILTKIKIESILFIEALGNYAIIRTFDKNHTVHLTLAEIEEKLSSEKFMRIHRSYIVALNKVDSIEDTTAFVHKTVIPIGERHHSVLLKKLNLF